MLTELNNVCVLHASFKGEEKQKYKYSDNGLIKTLLTIVVVDNTL